MKNRTNGLIIFMLLISTSLFSIANGQKEFGFKMPEKSKRVSISFEEQNNLIIIPVTINRFITLKFILDTGVETAILTEKLYADLLEIDYIREITIEGPGIIDSVEALIANKITFSLPGGIVGHNMNMIVLKEDYLQLSENIGDNVHGIIGYDIFSRFVVDINYDDDILTLIDSERFKKDKKSTEIPLKIKGTKPFINASIKQKDKRANLDIMVDTGASHASLIDYSYLDGISLPEKHIVTRLGRGVAGEIPGYIGRADSIHINSFSFDNILVSSPFEGAYNKIVKRGARLGTFGGELLSRFRVIFDYQREKMYLKKGNKFKENFEYNMSGLFLNAIGERLDTLKVINVEKNSPAYKSDIREGDIIYRINGKNLYSHKLSQLLYLLKSKDGQKIKIRIYRNGEKLKKMFYLKRII